jgi:hypothetical protein
MSLCGGLDFCSYSSNIGEIRTGQPLAIEDSVPRHHPSFPHFHLANALIEIATSQHLFDARFDFKTAGREFHETNRKPSLLYQFVRYLTNPSQQLAQLQMTGQQ